MSMPPRTPPGALSGLCFQLFVTTDSARAWTAAKKALSFAKVWNDGDEEGSLILDRLPTPSEATLIRRYVGVPKRREVSEATKARLAQTRKPFVAGRGTQAQEVAMNTLEAAT
jgi:hypothetical protein